MNFPPPTEKQARILWASLTSLAVAVLVGLIGLLLWGSGWVINRLSSVLLPLAVAGILACLLDPLVDWVERRLRIPRARAILLVFLVGLALVLALLAGVVPQLIVETRQLIDQVPTYAAKLRGDFSMWLAKSHLGAKAKEAWDSQYGEAAQTWLTKAVPGISAWLLAQLTKVASWAGLLIGLALVPIYSFYFLLEKRGIESKWTDYLPVAKSEFKDEMVFILQSINEYLIAFFRGQVLVALCDGALYTIGFLLIGLPYAMLVGVLATVLTIIPFVGAIFTCVAALIIAFVQFGDWQHPALVLVVVGIVQALEGLVISPRIMGGRVGLHPLTIIIAVMVGTTLLGGILGGILAIPLTAVLGVLMFRYVWKKPGVKT
ncbi:MAG: AI-2E family transporter [Verrucomicrobiota bacterium]